MNIIGDSYESISASLELESCLPFTPDWSAAPDFLKLIADNCLKSRPQTILECSSGITTLVLARCCQINNFGHVYSLENEDEYADTTSKQLHQLGLSAFADVIHSPLQGKVIANQLYDWYQTDKINISSVDMLVIDGPSGFIQKNSRYPALPVLFNSLSKGCKVFLDDASRPDEKEIVEIWLNEFPGLEHSYIGNERGCSVFTVNNV